MTAQVVGKQATHATTATTISPTDQIQKRRRCQKNRYGLAWSLAAAVVASG